MTDVTGAFLDELENVLRAEAVGPDNAITSGELASSVGIADAEANPKTREAVRILVEERQVPVAATSQGYFLMTNQDHLETYLETLDGRIAGIQDRKQIVTEAFNHWRYGEAAGGGNA